MRNKLMIGVILTGIIALVCGIVVIYKSFDTKPDETADIYDEKDIYTYVTENAGYITFADDLYVDGIVDVKEQKECVEIIELENRKELNYNFQIGQKFNTGDCIYELNGKQILAQNNYKLVDVVADEKTIKLSLLNYDNLCVVTEVDYENYKKIDINTSVEVSFDAVTYKGKIGYIDYVLNDNKVKIVIETDAKLLPGANVNVRFIYEEQKEYLCISSSFVMLQGEETYVQVNVGNNDQPELKDRKVELGKRFEIVENEHTFVCYEVLEGLKENEEIYIKVRAGEKIE